MKPLCIDLFCGLGGWSEGFLAEGYRCVGFDIERHVYYLPEAQESGGGMKGTKPVEKRGWTQGCAVSLGLEGSNKQKRSRIVQYPGQLVLQDILTVHGSQFRDAAVIVASPPCQKYSWLAMPWSRSKDPNNSKSAKALRAKWESEGPDNRLFDACFRIQREACEATRCELCDGVGRRCVHESQLTEIWDMCSKCKGTGGRRHIPLIVENVRGAQEWVGKRNMPLEEWNALSKAERYALGRSAWNFGSFHLWGDVPALMPINLKRGMKANPDGTNHPAGSWFAIADSKNRGAQSTKNTGGLWFGVAHNTTSGLGNNPVHEGQKTIDHVNKRDGHSHTRHLTNQAEHDAVKIGGDWFSDPNSTCRRHGSKSNARKAASAMIAKIPLALSQHIAQVYKPRTEAVA